jgi:hypothetical protein
MLGLLGTRVEVEDRTLEEGVVELSVRPAGAGALTSRHPSGLAEWR